VHVEHSVVTLSGSVDSERTRQAAEACAAACCGVKGVVNQASVKQASNSERTGSAGSQDQVTEFNGQQGWGGHSQASGSHEF